MHCRSVSSLPGILLLWTGWGVPNATASPVGRKRVPTSLLCLSLLFLVFSASPLSASNRPARANGFATYVDIPGASSVGSDTCTGCHAETSKNFQHAFHAQQGSSARTVTGTGACTWTAEGTWPRS